MVLKEQRQRIENNMLAERLKFQKVLNHTIKHKSKVQDGDPHNLQTAKEANQKEI